MENCIFCKIANGVIPSATIFENDDVRVIMDINPAAKGHAILLVKKHVANIFELDPDTAGRIFSVVPKVAAAIKKVTGCDGLNILQNNGTAAGQTVFHLHIHFIPRFENDKILMGWKPGSYADGEAAEIAAKIAAEIK
ncbi:MAG: HIT family protein [Lachnospiraceae bacterium]|nr:HIT family protein [Lachnospiraceae bacterium]